MSPSEAAQATPGKFPRPDKGMVLTVLFCTEITVFLRLFADGFDHAVVNVVSLILIFVAAISVLVWFLKSAKLSSTARRWIPLGILGAVGIFAATHRIESTTGNLLPKFRPRWQATEDARLPRFEQPNTTPNAAAAPASTSSIDFPQFLGPTRHPYVPGVTLATDWEKSPPKEIWRRKIGAGWSAFSVVNGFAVTMEQRGKEEWVTCYDAKTGEPRWGHSISVRHESILGGAGPRGTPTIDGGRVFALGATGKLWCLDGTNGKPIWSQSLFDLVGTNQKTDEGMIAWGRSASPLVVDGLVIVPGGGPEKQTGVSLIAFDRNTGEIRWRAGKTQIGYSSPTVMTLAGQRQIVSINESNVTAHQIEDGTVLWQHSWPGTSNADANTTQPVALGGDRFLLSKAYGGGGQVVQVTHNADQWTTEIVWHEQRVLKTKFANVVVHDGFAYGLSDGILECVDLSSGASRWKQKKRGSFAHGQVLGVGESLLVLGEQGELAHIALSPEQFTEHGRIQALHSSSDRNWNNLCLYGQLLLIRNDEEAACYELSFHSR